jgi:hypothetical protein
LAVDLDAQKAWVRRWREAGKALARVRREELRRLTPERALAATENLLALAAEAVVSGRRRRTSGLVAQQRLFSRLRP